MAELIARARHVAVASAFLIVIAGCHTESPPGESKGHEEEHAGHEIPAHKPRTFPDAVHRMRELNDRFLRVGAGSQNGSTTDSKSLGIALDIANWLPEIAADSDMPEAKWNEVNDRSARLVADYQELTSGSAADPKRELEQAKSEIGNLEKLLLACEPRWFTESGKMVVAP
jgi:hypothetical protein